MDMKTDAPPTTERHFCFYEKRVSEQVSLIYKNSFQQCSRVDLIHKYMNPSEVHPDGFCFFPHEKVKDKAAVQPLPARAQFACTLTSRLFLILRLH